MLSELEGLNIRAARLNYNLNQPIPEHKVFNKAKWSPSSYLYKERLACIPYQAYYEQTPSIITKLFSKHRTNYNLGDNPKFDLFDSKSKVFHNSFVHCASLFWKCLPNQLNSYSSFKANLTKCLKTVDQISFSTNSTVTNNTNTFVHFLLV